MEQSWDNHSQARAKFEQHWSILGNICAKYEQNTAALTSNIRSIDTATLMFVSLGFLDVLFSHLLKYDLETMKQCEIVHFL